MYLGGNRRWVPLIQYLESGVVNPTGVRSAKVNR